VPNSLLASLAVKYLCSSCSLNSQNLINIKKSCGLSCIFLISGMGEASIGTEYSPVSYPLIRADDGMF
jgi:hypothetical protein